MATGTKKQSRDASAASVDEIVAAVAGWPAVETGSHRFDGTAFRLAGREFGHVHRFGLLDINYPRRIRDALVGAGYTGEHHVVPESGWTSYRVRDAADVDGALWLLRVSYLYHVLLARRRSKDGDVTIPAVDVDAELADLSPPEAVREIVANLAPK
ncbi:luciferase family protein [Haloferacaceae archaeon DSL9]